MPGERRPRHSCPLKIPGRQILGPAVPARVGKARRSEERTSYGNECQGSAGVRWDREHPEREIAARRSTWSASWSTSCSARCRSPSACSSPRGADRDGIHAVRPGGRFRRAARAAPQPQGARRRSSLRPPALRERGLARARRCCSRSASACCGRRRANSPRPEAIALAARSRLASRCSRCWPREAVPLHARGSGAGNGPACWSPMPGMRAPTLPRRWWSRSASPATCWSWPLLDPVAALVVGLMVGKMGWEFLWDALHRPDRPRGLRGDARSSRRSAPCPACWACDLRTRRTSDMILVDVHLEIDRDLSVCGGHAIADAGARA